MHSTNQNKKYMRFLPLFIQLGNISNLNGGILANDWSSTGCVYASSIELYWGISLQRFIGCVLERFLFISKKNIHFENRIYKDQQSIIYSKSLQISTEELILSSIIKWVIKLNMSQFVSESTCRRKFSKRCSNKYISETEFYIVYIQLLWLSIYKYVQPNLSKEQWCKRWTLRAKYKNNTQQRPKKKLIFSSVKYFRE